MLPEMRGTALNVLSCAVLIVAITGCNSDTAKSEPTAVGVPTPIQADSTNVLTGPSDGLKSNANPFVVTFGPGTEAQYRVNEQLLRRNLPNDAVGVTNNVSGVVTFDIGGNVIPEQSIVTIDASTLKSDQGRRDNFIRIIAFVGFLFGSGGQSNHWC